MSFKLNSHRKKCQFFATRASAKVCKPKTPQNHAFFQGYPQKCYFSGSPCCKKRAKFIVTTHGKRSITVQNDMLSQRKSSDSLCGNLMMTIRTISFRVSECMRNRVCTKPTFSLFSVSVQQRLRENIHISSCHQRTLTQSSPRYIDFTAQSNMQKWSDTKGDVFGTFAHCNVDTTFATNTKRVYHKDIIKQKSQNNI